MAAAAAGWWVLVVAMTLDGYPGLERFYLPAAGLICVLAGMGVVRVGQLIGLVAARPGAGCRERRLGDRPAIVAVLVLISIPSHHQPDLRGPRPEPITSRAVTRLDQLSDAVAAVGGHDGVYPCKTSFSAVNHGVQTALAWKLRANLTGSAPRCATPA